MEAVAQALISSKLTSREKLACIGGECFVYFYAISDSNFYSIAQFVRTALFACDICNLLQ